MDKLALLERFKDPIPVLDHGHVRLVDVLGDDARVEAAARLSYQEGTRKTSEITGLLRHLLRNRHTTPFEKCVIELDIKMPIFVARQFVRHRTQSLNELSGRYSVLPEEYYVPDPEQICFQDTKNKQGRDGPLPLDEANHARANMRAMAADEFKHYHWMLDQGIARETSRMNLPLNAYTQWWSTTNLHNLLHFLSLRANPHAQWEAVQFANAIAKIVKAWVPITYAAFEDYVLHAHTFSRQEMNALRTMMNAFLDLEVEAERSSSLKSVDSKEFLKLWRQVNADVFDLGSLRERKAFWEALDLL